MIRIWHQLVMVISAGALLSGCSEIGLKEAMGYGKYSPDETQVQANQTLAMPPSLQLRPPSNTQTGSLAANPAQPSDLLATQKVTAQPPQYGAPDPSEAPPVYAAAAPAEPQALASTAPTQPQTLTPTAPQPGIGETPATQDVYERVGISKVHPDGRKKTKSELINELRALKIAEERKKNPNYGSIFNAGNIAWE